MVLPLSAQATACARVISTRAPHYKGRLVVGEEGNEGGDFLRPADATERHEAVEIGDGLARPPDAGFQHRRVDFAGADGVHARGPLAGEAGGGLISK